MRVALAVLIATLGGAPVAAQEYRVGGYMAWIGPEDLFNSSGERLATAEAVIQQDRANYHRFGIRHPGDDSDNWFFQREARAAMTKMIHNGGGIAPATARLILQGNVPVYVTIHAIDGNFTSLRVEVPG